MKQPLLPRRNWLGAGISLLVVIAAGAAAAWQVAELLADPARTPAASVPATPPPIDESAPRPGHTD